MKLRKSALLNFLVLASLLILNGCIIRISKRSPLVDYENHATQVLISNNHQNYIFVRMGGVIYCEAPTGGLRDCESTLEAHEERIINIFWRARIIKDSTGRVVRLETPVATFEAWSYVYQGGWREGRSRIYRVKLDPRIQRIEVEFNYYDF